MRWLLRLLGFGPKPVVMATRSGAPQCPMCREGVKGGRGCRTCGARAHRKCVKELGTKSCPTPGCAGKLRK
jgi:hypothetical protein